MDALTVICRTIVASAVVTSALSHSGSVIADEPTVALPPVLGAFYDYPASARRLDQQGRFLVEFSITGEGRVVDVALLAADPKGVFDRSLVINLRRLRFNVPRDWVSSGRSTRRFRVNVIFLLRPCREKGPCVALPPLTADPAIAFTGSPIGK